MSRKRRRFSILTTKRYNYVLTCRPILQTDSIPTTIKSQHPTSHKPIEYISSDKEYHEALYHLIKYLKEGGIAKDPLIFEIVQIASGTICGWNSAVFSILTHNGEIQRWGNYDEPVLSEWELKISSEELESDTSCVNFKHEVLEVNEYV
jgi:hypothetical protein